MGRGFASPSLVNDITRPVSRPAKSGSRLPLTKYLKSNRKAKPSVRVGWKATRLAEENLRASEIWCPRWTGELKHNAYIIEPLIGGAGGQEPSSPLLA